MVNDIRVYNYDENGSLITRVEQYKKYLDNKFSDIHCKVDLSDVTKTITDSKIEIEKQLTDSTCKIEEKIDTIKPCLCNIATKEDVCKAKCSVINKIESSKEEIIKDIDEKFVDLNELVK